MEMELKGDFQVNCELICIQERLNEEIQAELKADGNSAVHCFILSVCCSLPPFP